MWTALVLVCVTNLKDTDNCYSVMAPALFKTEIECVESIARALNAGIFKSSNMDFVEYLCYDWEKGPKV